jgi:N-acyl-D-amino-acid deacylase
MKKIKALLACAILASVAACAQTTTEYDLIIRSGTVIDGTGSAKQTADVAISGGTVAKIGDLSNGRAAREIDARGLYVVPGFINIHGHSRLEALANAEELLTQGVTTDITNSDGGSPVDLGGQLAEFEKVSLAINIGGYIGFNSIWQEVVGEGDRRSTAAEIERMRNLVTRGLEAGAWGVSSGLDYKPAYFATTQEVISVVEAARPWRTNFPNHDRLTPETNLSSLAGIGETIRIGAAAGLVPVVTHIKAQGREQGRAEDILALMRDAGVYAPGDVYPYVAGMTRLSAFFIPGWAQEGGREAMLARFQDPETRARIVAEGEDLMTGRVGGPQNVFIVESQRELTDIMAEMGAGAGETIVRLVSEGEPTMIGRFGTEEDMEKFILYPDMAIACDCGAWPAPQFHPRGTGTFPRVLGRHVREQGLLSWEDAVRKMSGLPATIIGAVDRGFLAPGMAADIAIFDPATIIDRSTYQQPALLSEGMRHVLVNGVVALADGQTTHAGGGKAIRRRINMPSRPMSTHLHRRLSASAVLPDGGFGGARRVTVTVDVAQRPGANATGTLALIDGAGRRLLRSTEIGLLQTTEGWAGLTSHVVTATGEHLPLLLTVEREDASLGTGPSLTLQIGDNPPVTGKIAPDTFLLAQSNQSR